MTVTVPMTVPGPPQGVDELALEPPEPPQHMLELFELPELAEPELSELPQHMLVLELLLDTADREPTLEPEPPLEEVPHEMVGLSARRCRPNADAS